jgi:putative membrane protein
MRILPTLCLTASAALFVPGAAVAAAETTSAESHATAARMVDADFAADTAAGGVAEIEMAKLAKEKSTNEAVTAFADQMIADHGAASAQLKQVAAKLGWTLPTDMGPRHRETYANLEKLSGAQFDAAYRLAMVSDHSKTVAAFQQQAEYGKTPELSAFARTVLPKLQHHLEMAQALPGGD